MDIKNAIAQQLTRNMSDGLLKTGLDQYIPGLIGLIISIILALISYWIGIRIISIVRKIINKSLKRHNIEEGVSTFLDSLIKLVLNIGLFVFILGIFGVTSTSIAAAVAALGLTAGLSLQGALSNFAGGVLILMLKPFHIGDFIIEDTKGNMGEVIDISIFYTKIMSPDGRIVVIPNGSLANNSLVNLSTSGKRREDIVIGITYDSDIKTAKEVLTRLLNEETRALNDEDKLVFVKDLADSSVDIGVRFWTSVDEYWQTQWDFIEKAKYELEAAGVVIAFPQMDVHIDQISKN